MKNIGHGLVVFSIGVVLSACGSFVDIRDMSKLSQQDLQVITEVQVYEQRDLKKGSYQSLGEFHGYSCKLTIGDKPATKSDAMRQLKNKVLEAGGEAIVTSSCYGEGTTYSKNCWEAFTCSGTAVVLGPDSLIASKEEPQQIIQSTQTSFPEKAVKVSFQQVVVQPDDVAVIIGNADYEKGRDIPNVVPAYADAEGVKSYVTQALGIKEENIIYLKDAGQSELTATFGSATNPKGQLFNYVKPGKSKVFVYYSGHGAPGGEDGSSYIVPTDAQASMIDLNGYPLSTLYKNLGKIPAKSVTVVLEACFSGASQSGSVITQASPIYLKAKETSIPSNITVIAAGAANQIASWEQDSSSGLFTKYFLKGMSGEADVAPYGNGDGKVGYDELGAYFKDTLTYYARRYYGRDQTVQIVEGGLR